MLTLRSEQIAAMVRAANEPFIKRLSADIQQIFPEQWAELGADGVREAIEAGIGKAARYRMTRQREVAQFVMLMFGLGLDFDTDPQFAWAQSILRDLNKAPQERLDLIVGVA